LIRILSSRCEARVHARDVGHWFENPKESFSTTRWARGLSCRAGDRFGHDVAMSNGISLLLRARRSRTAARSFLCFLGDGMRRLTMAYTAGDRSTGREVSVGEGSSLSSSRTGAIRAELGPRRQDAGVFFHSRHHHEKADVDSPNGGWENLARTVGLVGAGSIETDTVLVACTASSRPARSIVSVDISEAVVRVLSCLPVFRRPG